MTMKYERLHAVNRTRELLQELLDPSLTPKVPRYIRDRASRLLRHYPSGHDMIRACDGHEIFAVSFDDEFSTPEERMVKRIKAKISDV